MSNVRSPRKSTTKAGFAAGVAQFAGIMLTIAAIFQILQGIAALANDSVFVKGPNYTYKFDVTVWGWIHLLIGVVGLAVGVAIVLGSTVGYLGGIGVAALGTVMNFLFLPYYPVWSLLVIGFDVLVIWALCTQLGRDRVDEDYYARSASTGGSPAASAGSSTHRRPSDVPPTAPR